MKKNIYSLLILFSYPITLLILNILRNVTHGEIGFNDIAIILITLSIIVFSIIKYKEQ